MEIELRLIKDTNHLEGTCYFEFLPGKYRNKCWNQGSVFLSEEAYDLLEACFSENIKGYDHYAFMEADQDAIEKIIHCLNKLEKQIEKSISAEGLSNSMKINNYQRSELELNWPESKYRLKAMVEDINHWLQKVIKENEVISILGM
jgi:hypothetical protein